MKTIFFVFLLALFSSTYADDAWQMRNELMAEAPNVSQKVLETAANSGVLPDALLFEVLAANPASIRNRDFLARLATDIPNPLPQYMVDWLIQMPEPASMRKNLEQQISYHSAKMAESIGVIITDILADSTANSDSLLHYVQKLPTPHADYNVVDILVEKGEYAAAQAYLATLPNLHNYITQNNTEFETFSNFMAIKIALVQSGRNWTELTESELSAVQSIAQSEGLASIQAQSVLCFLLGDCPDININIVPPVNQRALSPLPQNLSILNSFCSASPNPAQSYISFEYLLPQDEMQAKLNIIDLTGKVIETLNLSTNQGITTYHTEKLANGMYFYEIVSKDKKVFSDKFSVNK